MKKKIDSIKKLLRRDIKEFNSFVLVFVSLLILVISGLFSYFLTNSYALFTDSVKGEKILQLTATTKLDSSGANEPVLADNMIPVYYDETNAVWRKADEANTSSEYKWYDYDSKMWANAVTVSSTSSETTLTLDDGSTTSCSGSTCVRSDYVNAELGTVIPMDDILTMQVWIPRYKYTVWNYNLDGTSTNEIQEVQIEFEEGTAITGEIECEDNLQGSSDGTLSGASATTSEICKIKSTSATCTDATCNGKTYTHPAFTFGDEELTGFWVGKFELTGTESSITTKPDLSSLRNQSISQIEINIMKMNDTDNMYGFISSNDTHMIKNMEWAATIYLSRSKYGTCTNGTCQEVNINNSSEYYTGRSGGSIDAATTVDGTYSYNEIGTPGSDGPSASTTLNIYGVYDMSGGSLEYVMATVLSYDGITMMSGANSYNTGYAGYHCEFSGEEYTLRDGIAYPDSKYLDIYSFGMMTTAVDTRSKLGDASREIMISGFLSVQPPWYVRGGHSESGGLLKATFIRDQLADLGISSRFVLLP